MGTFVTVLQISAEKKINISKERSSGFNKGKSRPGYKSGKDNKRNPNFRKKRSAEPELIRLNKYIANAGICSRREADKLIESGIIKVNGKVVTDLGTKISPLDTVKYDNQTLKIEKKQYVLLNKPKGYLTTTDDPFDRKTIMSLIKNASRERIYPVGRLDKDTTGLLLLTNDGDLAKKLTHPKHKVNKLYHVVLDKSLTKNDFSKIVNGIVLDDGPIKVDKLAYVNDSASKKEVGIELHSGRNRIIRRIFESLNYRVVKLDRVAFATLTKKDIPRGKWRHLTEKEINFLRML